MAHRCSDQLPLWKLKNKRLFHHFSCLLYLGQRDPGRDHEAMPCPMKKGLLQRPPQPWGNIFPCERGYNLPVMGWSNTEYWQDETEQETRTLLPSLYLGRNFFSDSRLIPLKPSKSTQIYIWHLANHWDGS